MHCTMQKKKINIFVARDLVMNFFPMPVTFLHHLKVLLCSFCFALLTLVSASICDFWCLPISSQASHSFPSRLISRCLNLSLQRLRSCRTMPGTATFAWWSTRYAPATTWTSSSPSSSASMSSLCHWSTTTNRRSEQDRLLTSDWPISCMYHLISAHIDGKVLIVLN